MRALAASAVFTAALAALAGPAGAADDVAVVTAGVAAAAAQVHSFVVQTTLNGTTGVSGTMTFVRPQRVKFEYTIGTTLVDTYLVDGFVYIHAPGGGWQKVSVDTLHAPQQSFNIADSIKASKVTLLPDRQEAGASVGALQIVTQLPASAGPIAQSLVQGSLVCTYEKATFRMRSCANGTMTMTYSKYNDPANVVVLPPEAKNAVPISVPTLAPAPSTPASSGPAAPQAMPSAAAEPAVPAPSPSTAPLR